MDDINDEDVALFDLFGNRSDLNEIVNQARERVSGIIEAMIVTFLDHHKCGIEDVALICETVENGMRYYLQKISPLSQVVVPPED